jgi:hypothetical protein
MTTINEAKAIAARIKAIHEKRWREEQREEYYGYRAEARACGYEVMSFEEFIGERDLKAEFAEYYADMSEMELAAH